jgi:hypothetical protein
MQGLALMSTPDDYLTYGLLCLGIGITLLYAAIAGFLDIEIRGTSVFGLRVKSTRLRVVLFVLSVGFFAVASWMIRHFLSPARTL